MKDQLRSGFSFLSRRVSLALAMYEVILCSPALITEGVKDVLYVPDVKPSIIGKKKPMAAKKGVSHKLCFRSFT